MSNKDFPDRAKAKAEEGKDSAIKKLADDGV